MNPIEDLSPKSVWKNFYALTQIPHPSGHTEKIASYLVDFAKAHGADAYITKPFNVEILRQNAMNLIKGRELLKNNFTGNQVQEEKIKKIEAESPDERLLKRVMKVINDNMSNSNLNVEMIAAEVGISRVHLHRKLKELTNQSTRDFIRNVRLKQAADLLAEKKHSVSEVAALTGFTNLPYFSTVFKDTYGVSPSNYTNREQEE